MHCARCWAKARNHVSIVTSQSKWYHPVSPADGTGTMINRAGESWPDLAGAGVSLCLVHTSCSGAGEEETEIQVTRDDQGGGHFHLEAYPHCPTMGNATTEPCASLVPAQLPIRGFVTE